MKVEIVLPDDLNKAMAHKLIDQAKEAINGESAALIAEYGSDAIQQEDRAIAAISEADKQRFLRQADKAKEMIGGVQAARYTLTDMLTVVGTAILRARKEEIQ